MTKRRGRGEGSIYQRQQDGRWVGTIDLGYAAGRRVRRSYYGVTRKEVQEKLAHASRSVDLGLRIDRERMSLAAFLTSWLDGIVVRPSTARRYEQIVRVHLIPHLGRIRVASLTPQDVEAMLRAVQQGRSARTAAHVRAVLRTALTVAVRDGLALRNAASQAKAPRIEYRQVESMSPEQVATFLRTIEGDRLEALYVLALATGMRRGELLGLRWSDLDWTEGVIRVTAALQKVDGEYQRVEPKTARSRRTVTLPAVAVDALRRHRVREEERTVQPIDGYVFTTRSGIPFDGTNVTRWFQGHLVAAGLPRVPFHALRHTAASLLLARGVHPRVVMEILGHSQISLTLNTYSHVIPALQREAADQLNEALTAS